MATSIAVALVQSRLDYANSLIYDTVRYDTIEEINVDSKAEYTA